MRKFTLLICSLVLSGCLFQNVGQPSDDDIIVINNVDPNVAPNVAPNVEPGNIAPNNASTCGNGRLDPGETCDDTTDTPCALDCPPVPGGCTRGERRGSPETCDIVCRGETMCGPADTCCPGGDGCFDDPDCQAPQSCGNGELDEGELCDPNIDGEDACPEACPPPPDSCTTITLVDGGPCMVACVSETAPDCVPCALDGRACPCEFNEICGPNNYCITSDQASMCEFSCVPNDYCLNLGGPTFPNATCLNATCVQCQTNLDCDGAQEWQECIDNSCVDCASRTEPNQVCRNAHGASAVCIGSPGQSFCTSYQCVDIGECEGEFQQCVTDPTLTKICEPAPSCADAQDRDQWCDLVGGAVGLTCNAATETCD